MLPFGGQGANQAIEDAGALGRVLDNVQDSRKIATRLQMFESIRIKRASIIQILSKVRAGREKEVEKEVQEFLEPGVRAPESLTDRNVHAYSHDVIAAANQTLRDEGLLDRDRVAISPSLGYNGSSREDASLSGNCSDMPADTIRTGARHLAMAWIEYSPIGRHHATTSSSALASTRGKIALLLVATLGLLTFFMYSYSDAPALLPFIGGESKVTLPIANLHLLVPASHSDVNLCKVLLSAAILGYPSPVIINWNTTFEIEGQVEGGAHLAKISGVYEYLKHLNSTHDEDLVVLVDGYDIWMQLRPQVLIDRYFDMNRRADQRIQNELGGAAEAHGIRQEVIFGCQKRCWPWHADDPACYAVPNSTLPEDIFGPNTDTMATDAPSPYVQYRPRFLNSGVGMGSVRAMRKLFHQAFDQAKYERNFGSDQYILSHIFGDQELWREALRRDFHNVSSNYHGEHDHFNAKHIADVRKKAAGRRDKNFEFGLGVDYGSEIALNTVFAEDDTDWLVFNDQHQLQEAQKTHKIPNEQQRANELASDISTGLAPFAALPNDDSSSIPWHDVALFTDVYTGISPAVIHHNAHRDNLKSLRETWWPLVWFQTRARALLHAYAAAPLAPVALSGYDEASRREWWAYDHRKGGAIDGLSADWITFDDTCREFQPELFRDDKVEKSLVLDGD
nr:hypothetical protein CFP56_71928 [Quercus suber]